MEFNAGFKQVFFCVAVLALISGCATHRQFSYYPEATNHTPSFTVSDKRPSSEKEAEVLSVNVMNDNYGIYRIGDTQLSPDRIAYLIRKLSKNINNQLTDKNIIVDHFEIHNNLQKVLKKSATFGAFGLVGGVVSGFTDNPDALIDVKLQLTVDGRPYNFHIVHGYKVGKWKGASNEMIAKEIHLAMENSISQFTSSYLKDI
jgi:hypothetical protein